MKSFFGTKENGLLIIPLLTWLFEKKVTGYAVADPHLHDTYFVFSNVSFGMCFLMMILLSFV